MPIDTTTILHFTLLALLVLFVLLAIEIRDLLKATISLGVASVVLAIIFYQLSVSYAYAAVFELSVCAGLITVLFVSTINLTLGKEGGNEG